MFLNLVSFLSYHTMLTLKFILILFVFGCACVLSDDMQELKDTLHATCTAEIDVSEDSIAEARKGNFLQDEKLKCYMRCVLDQMGCIEDDGTIDIEATVALLPPELQESGGKTVRTCGNKVGANSCDTVFLTNQCWYNQSPSEYFLV